MAIYVYVSIQSLCYNNDYTPSPYVTVNNVVFVKCLCVRKCTFARACNVGANSIAKCRFTHFPSFFSVHVDTYGMILIYYSVSQMYALVLLGDRLDSVIGYNSVILPPDT